MEIKIAIGDEMFLPTGACILIHEYVQTKDSVAEEILHRVFDINVHIPC